MSVIRRAAQRVHETPNAEMTTLASPTLGGAAQSVWWVRMRADQTGPAHVMDREQVWTVVEGAVTVEPYGRLDAGDSIVLPGGRVRRVVPGPDGVSALVTAPGDSRATLPDGTDRGVPDWIA
ncbi:cupin domain-containing protein [Pseudonocardia sp. WMMC193]|uniref:cupin domain-containing protein n=1 Tax=Pseudonocardia sp. WMMC193 TaxID=2911965 RepID=UPI001F28CB32|nr:cupin domain-containing protein [Pseudonocardia sp. WMMC193]MCF7550218.1 cupin domain-containing protein [Pseudonocardia sp. WMMC193]